MTDQCDILAGNLRFVNSANYAHQRQRLTSHQQPSTLIVRCSDSRITPAIIFQQLKLGTIFEVATAGHVLDQAGLETVNYAVNVLGVHNVIVLGHEGCGAVNAAWESQSGHHGQSDPCQSMAFTCDAIKPSVVLASSSNAEADKAAIYATTIANISRTMQIIINATGIDPSLVHGAYYPLATGKVRWFCNHAADSGRRAEPVTTSNSTTGITWLLVALVILVVVWLVVRWRKVHSNSKPDRD